MKDRDQMEAEVVMAERHVEYALKNATAIHDREKLSIAKQALEQVASPPRTQVEFSEAEAEEVLEGLMAGDSTAEAASAYRKVYRALAMALGGKERIASHLPERLV